MTRQFLFRGLPACLVATSICSLRLASAADPAHADPPAMPDKYIVNYPAAQQFCPPVESYFDDVTQLIQQIGGRRVRHAPNGGYGLPVVTMVNGKHLIHLGADVSWSRPGAPVYAIANGVVRVSTGPPPKAAAAPPPAGTAKPQEDDDEAEALPTGKQSAAAKPPAKGWGNIIVIEHQLPDGTYATSIYGHLTTRRLVEVGDIVRAGQPIGFVGKAGVENGFYDPHLHFGIRDGRMFKPQTTLFNLEAGGKPSPVKIANMTDSELEVEVDVPLPDTLPMPIAGHDFSMTTRDGKHFMPAGILHHMMPPDFAITGYALSTDGWRDPTEFLRLMAAEVAPAPYSPIPKAVAARTRK
jgi:hypothetical protein